MCVPENRTPTGRFPPGQSGNPGGRPRVDPAIKEALTKAGPRAARKLGRLVNSLDEKIALAAASRVLELLGVGRSSPVEADDYGTKAVDEVMREALDGLTPEQRARALEHLQKAVAH